MDNVVDITPRLPAPAERTLADAVRDAEATLAEYESMTK